MAPRKRARATGGGSVTGGTGDVKPQIMTLDSGALANDNQYAVASAAMPLARTGFDEDDVQIVEILKVWWYMGMTNLIVDLDFTESAFLATTTGRVFQQTATTATIANDSISPFTFANAIVTKAVSTNGGLVHTFPITIDLTDSNGNGILIATERLFVVHAQLNVIAADVAVAKILYRMVNVGLKEYVGIVTSQQARS